MIKMLRRKVLLFILCSLLLQVFGINKVHAAIDVIDIDSEEDLISVVHMSEAYDFEGVIINLNTDITISGKYEGHNTLTINKNNETPFKGTFNGNNHTIYNLNHHSNLELQTCTGLFGYTDGAIIKDLTIADSYIGADSLGAALVGRAYNTRIENIRVTNTTISVKCADNVITLITDGGLVGGGIAGVLENSVMYNCQVDNSEIVNHATEAVAAVDGKGLYLGGLVGDSQNSTIEYSRVINNTRIKNIYDVVVGAAGGNTLYVGGIAGELRKGSKVIDCYSSANLNFYCATYVSVASGNSGHIGGIAGATYGNRDQIIRSHFVGSATSTQYNAVLVIPLVQNDVNLYGLVDKNDGEYIESSYYMSSTSNWRGSLGDGGLTDNSGSLTDDTYANRDFFEENGYDIVGSIIRDTAYSNNHINKWVMYHDKTMNKVYPIHATSFMSGFDYPDAASVTILANSINDISETTNSAYKYAIQIVPNNELQTVVVTPKNGYKFYAWYKTKANSTTINNHDYYDEIFINNSPISNETGYTFNDVEDKDLYLARMQALVNYYDYQNNLIDRSGQADSITSDNYYFYKEKIPEFEPDNKPNDENQRFIGWTSVAGQHLSITSNELENLKANKQFYEAKDEITSTLNLYPVYASLISNIHLIYEGNELDNNDDITLREGYGYLNASIDDNNIATIKVNYEYNDLSHYRFLGWYEDNHRVSKDEIFVLEDVDLTQEHTYIARFEYLVDYYVRNKSTDTDSHSYRQGALYQSVWHKYNETTKQIAAPDFFAERFDGWVLDNYDSAISSIDHIISNADEKIYSKYTYTGSGTDYMYTFSMTTDFPNSATLTDNGDISNLFTITLTENSGYHLQFWSTEAYRLGAVRYQGIGNNNPYLGKHGTSSAFGESLDSYESYRYHARMLADITFNQYDQTSTTILRGYQENILQDSGNVRSYYYVMNNNQISSNDINNLGGQINIDSSPDALNRPGYYFAGWIDKDNLNDDEINYIFDIDEYTSSSLNKVRPYIIKDSDLVEKTMPNIYAVYVPFNIITTTNIKEIGIKAPQNLPSDPTYSGLDNSNETSDITFVVLDDEEYVIGDSGDKYSLIKFTVSVNGNEEEILNSFNYNVKAGNTYIFKAYYEPLIINFHINNDNIVTYIRNSGEAINRNNEIIPMPEFNVDGLFVGYCENETNGEYHLINQDDLDNYILINGNSIVNHSMVLYPVYVRIAISVNSNIDQYLINQGIELNDVYNMHKEIDYVKIQAINNINNYQFIAWYMNYIDDDNMGELVSNDLEVIIDAEDAFKNTIYTAIYKETVSINYHNNDENRSILYSTNIISNTRSFVEDIIYNDPITGEEKIIENSPIDSNAFELMFNQLSDDKLFIEWVYYDGNDYYHWNEFSNQLINKNMDLYPVILEAVVKETPLNKNGNVIFENDVDFISLELNNENINNEIIYSYDAYFNKEYYWIDADLGDNLRNEIINDITLLVSETIYLPEIIYQAKDNIKVSLYKEENGNIIEEKYTDINGKVDYKLYSLLTININSEDEEDFIVIVKRSDGENYIPYQRFSINESKIIKLPYGIYSIELDNDYAWRYLNKQAINNIILSNMREGEAEFTLTKNFFKWFDYNQRKVNQFE